MILYIFTGDLKYIDWERKFSHGIEHCFVQLRHLQYFDKNCIIFDGEQTRRGQFLISSLAGKQIFSAGPPSTLAGQCFSRVVTGGGGVSKLMRRVLDHI